MNEKHKPSDGLISGVLPAVLSPLRADLSPDHARHIKHCNWLLANGCDGLAIHGTTGEANSFSVGERVATLEALAAGGIDGGRIIAGTGCCALPDSVTLNKAALQIGAAGVLMLPPFYYKNVNDEGLFAGYSEVIQRVGDDALKIYLYHFPALSGVPITLPLIERLLGAYPNTVVGVKDSAGDFENMRAMATQFPGFNVFAGSERLLLDCLEIGGAGTISATVNVTSLQASKVFAAWKNGDDKAAKEHQERLSNSRLAIEDYPLVPALKTIMARYTGDDSWLTLRPPLVALPEAKSTALFDAIERIELDLAEAA